MVTAVDAGLLMESRASAPDWTGETPVPPPLDSSRGHGTGNSRRGQFGGTTKLCATNSFRSRSPQLLPI